MAKALENAICAGIVDAHKQYEKMTGQSLRHAPEAFLSTLIATKISKKLGYSVYMDAALSRIARERAELGIAGGKGPKSKNLSLRPDISVWGKTTGGIRAAIEVKRAPWTAGISSDVEKLRKIVGKHYGPKAGYVVAHTTADEEKTVNARIDKWISSKSQLIKRDTGNGGDGRVWGYALLKVKPLG
jgi:hypothetical protein